MTISPVAAPMAAPTSAGPSGGGSASTDFEALVQQHLGQEHLAEEGSCRLSVEEAAAMLEAALLAGMLAGPRAGDGGTAPEGKGDGTTDSGTGASGSAMPVDGATAAMTTSGGAVPGAVLPGVPLGGSAVTVVGPGGTGDGTGTDNGNGGGPVIAAPAGASGGRTHALLDAAGASREADEAAGADVPAGVEQGDVQPDAALLNKTGSAGPTTVPSEGTAGTASGTTDSSVGGAAPGGLTGAGSSAGATAGGDTAGADAVRGKPVADQVFGHVTRLVSRGDGTHRLMLRLHPADLGEVKVVLTVRDNTVDVTLSAGPAAREALRDGSPQLRALLELTGATTGQVVIRDHAGAATFSSTSDSADRNGDPQGNGGRDRAGLADTRADSGGSRSSRHGDHGPTRPSLGAQSTSARASGTATHIPTRLDLNL